MSENKEESKQVIDEMYLKNELNLLKNTNSMFNLAINVIKNKLDSVSQDVGKLKESLKITRRIMKKQLLNTFKLNCAIFLEMQVEELYSEENIHHFYAICKDKYGFTTEDIEYMCKIKYCANAVSCIDEEMMAYVLLNESKIKFLWHKIFSQVFKKNAFDVQQNFAEYD